MQADKYTIAWFKIAECVSRGEKERALGVYRLLSHSFNDDALSYQLEADIHLACNEQAQAIELYLQAFQAYKKTKRYMEAAAIGEHLCVLLPDNTAIRLDIIVAYNNVGIASKMYSHAKRLIDVYIRDNKWYEVEHFVEDLHLSSSVSGVMYHHIIVSVHARGGHKDLIVRCIEKGINELLQEGNEQALQEFLAMLCAIDEELYQHALENLEQR